MSIRVMSRVWDTARCSGSDLTLMLALADRADEDSVCWPGMEHLAKKCRLGERQVQRMVQEGEKRGELYVVRNCGRGRSNFYLVAAGLGEAALLDVMTRRFRIPAQEAKEQVGGILKLREEYEKKQKGDMDDTFSENKKGDMQDVEKVTCEAEKVTSGVKKVTCMSPNTLEDSSEDSPDDSPIKKRRRKVPEKVEAAAAFSENSVFLENIAELKKFGVGRNGRVEKLARMEHVRPDYIRAFGERLARQGKISPGLLIMILERGDEAPEKLAIPTPRDDLPTPEDAPAHPAWREFVEDLRGEMPRAAFESQVAGLRAEFLEAENRMVISAHSQEGVRWLEDRLRKKAARFLAGALGREVEVVFKVGDG